MEILVKGAMLCPGDSKNICLQTRMNTFCAFSARCGDTDAFGGRNSDQGRGSASHFVCRGIGLSGCVAKDG